MRTLRFVPFVLLLLTPSLAVAQGTVNSRMLDGSGNRLESATTTPSGIERAILVRPIPGATQPVSLPTSAASLASVQDVEAAIRDSQTTIPFLVTGIGAALAESIAVRCVNAANSAFESCAGAGGSGGSSLTDQAAFTAGSTAFTAIGGYRDDTSPSTLSEGQSGAARLTTNRALHVNLRDAAGAELGLGGGVAQGSTTSGQTGALTQGAVTTAAPSYTTAQTSPLSLTTAGGLRTDTSAIAGTTTSTGNGTVGAGVQRVAIASDNTAFSVNAVQSGTWTVQPGNTANSTPWIVSQVPATSGGGSTCYLSSAASTNATNCKASAGQVYHISAINTTATLYYLRTYNLASAPTCSSATGFIETLPIPASTTGSGFQRGMVSGQAYSTGIGFCLTGGGSSTDNTNAATGVYLSVIYK